MRTDELSVMIYILAVLLVSTIGFSSCVSDLSEFYRLHDIPEWNNIGYGLNFPANFQISDKNRINTIKLVDLDMLGDEFRMLLSRAMENLSSGKFPSGGRFKIPVGLGKYESQMPIYYEDIREYLGAANGGTIQLPEHVSYRGLQFREISDGFRESSGGVDVIWNFS